jgi:S1-C subfamily serine protease
MVRRANVAHAFAMLTGFHPGAVGLPEKRRFPQGHLPQRKTNQTKSVRVRELPNYGRIARGWLGVALQAVAVPDALRETTDQSSGLMVMSVVDGGPAAKAGIVAGDIILSVGGTSTHRYRKIARHFGSDSIGQKTDLRLIRGGTVITVQTLIAERPAA